MTVTPGYQFAAGERATKDKLNALGKPAVTLDDGEITEAKLALNTQNKLASLRGKNLLCNGSFQLWDSTTYAGLVTSPNNHEYGFARRWVAANDANRSITRQQFLLGVIDVPDNPTDFLRWNQTAPLVVSPAYLGQRLEDVRRFSGQTLTFSIYLRPGAALNVTPRVRQWFGNTNVARTTGATIGVTANTMSDSANGFKLLDVGSTVTGTGIAAGTTITGYVNAGLVTLNSSQTTNSGLTVTITNTAPSSPPVIVPAATVALPAGVWTRLVQTFNVPSVAGMLVPDIIKSFTEVRVDMPPGITFQMDFANAQLEVASVVSPVERRLFHEDFAYSLRYTESINFMLSNNVGVWKPSYFLFPKLYTPVLTLYPVSGTGATVSQDPLALKEFLYQATNHTNIVLTGLKADCELRD